MNTTAIHIRSTTAVRSADRRTKRSGRFASAIEIAVIVALSAAVVFAIGAADGNRTRVENTMTVRVEAGDTLWEIAAAHPVPGASTRESIAAISEINGVEGGTLRVGQVLTVPAPISPDMALAAR